MQVKKLFAFVLLIFVLGVHCGCPFFGKANDNDLTRVVEEIVVKQNESEIPAPTATDPLVAMNLLLQQNYDKTKTNLLNQYLQNDPVLVLNQDSLLFWHEGSYTNYTIVPEIYTNLKLVCHVALGTFVLLEELQLNEPHNTSATLQAMKAYSSFIPKAMDDLTNRNFTSNQLERANIILNHSMTILEEVNAMESITEQQILNYTRPLTIPISRNIEDAAISQLLMTNDVVTKIKEQLTDEDWGKLRVILPGSHMARHGALLSQYFSKVLDTRETSGERIIYAEGLDLTGSLDLLSVHLIDFSVGHAFWDSGEHMHWDILAGPTHKILPWIGNNLVN